MTGPDLQESIAKQERKLASDKRRLASIQRGCDHAWGPTCYTPDIREGYHVEGDPVGTMGIDRQHGHYVARMETPKWARTCAKCAKTETTTRINQKIQVTPKF